MTAERPGHARRHRLRSAHARLRAAAHAAAAAAAALARTGRPHPGPHRDSVRIEIRDGAGIVRVPALSAPGLCEKLRELHDAADGSVWFGTTALRRRRPAPGRHARSTASAPTTAIRSWRCTPMFAPRRTACSPAAATSRRAAARPLAVRQRALDAVRSLMQARDGTSGWRPGPASTAARTASG